MDLFKQAQSFHQQGNFNAAKKCYEKCLHDNAKHAQALHALGILHAQLSEYNCALDYLEQAIALAPTDASMHNHLGNLLKKLNRFDDALTAFNVALKLQPHFFEAMNNLGNVLFVQEKYSEALEYYQNALALNPLYLDALYNIGLSHNKVEQIENAIESFITLLNEAPGHFGGQFHLGTLYLKEHKLPQSIHHLTLAVDINPYHVESHINLGHAYLQTDKLDEALIHYQAALELEPNSIEAHYNLAIIAQEKNNLDLAIQHYQQVLNVDQSHFSAHNNLGVIFIKKQLPTFALKHFVQAQKLNPDQIALNYIIEALNENKQLDGAPKEYIKALFDNYAKNFDEHILASLEYVVPEKCHNALAKVAAPPNHKWIIADLGCGTGLCGQLFKQYAKKLIGIDLSPNMLAKASEKKLYDELQEADIDTYLANHPDAFNCLIAADVLVYYGNLDTLFHHAQTALTKNGLFVFSVEISAEEDFCLMQSGRYAHSVNYIHALARKHHLTPVLIERHKTRLQFAKDVMGLIVVLQKL